MEFHDKSSGVFCLVQLMPSEEVITWLLALLLVTATNKPLPYVTDFQDKVEAAELEPRVQLTPSELVIMPLLVPPSATATNMPLP
jgi:hypothetical protein